MSDKFDIYSYFWNDDKKEPDWQKIRRYNTYLTFRQKICALYLLKDRIVKKEPPGKRTLKNIIFQREYRNQEERSFKIYLKDELSQLKMKKDYVLKLDFVNIPKYSCLIEIEFKLKKPYFSKDDDNFYIIDNPIAKDKVFKLPMVRSTTWKGVLRFAARFVDYEGKDEIIVRLFGNEKGEESNFRQGRLFFYPTFFDQISLEVITPLSRETRTPVRGPIYFEIVPENTTGTLRFLYYPFDLVARGEFDKIKEEMRVDLKFLSKALRKMFYEIGFSAKKTSGFGTAEVISVDVSCGEKLKEYKNHVWAIFKDRLKDGVNNGS